MSIFPFSKVYSLASLINMLFNTMDRILIDAMSLNQIWMKEQVGMQNIPKIVESNKQNSLSLVLHSKLWSSWCRQLPISMKITTQRCASRGEGVRGYVNPSCTVKSGFTLYKIWINFDYPRRILHIFCQYQRCMSRGI